MGLTWQCVGGAARGSNLNRCRAEWRFSLVHRRARLTARQDRGARARATIDTAIVEMTHGFAHRIEPLTIVEYDVDVADIVDLRTDAARRAADIELADMSCGWRNDLDNGREPASWRIANRLRQTAAGILVPSYANGARADMYNLVLWTWGPHLPHRVSQRATSEKPALLGHAIECAAPRPLLCFPVAG